MRLTQAQKNHILSKNNGDLLYNGNPAWIARRNKSKNVVILVNSVGDRIYADLHDVYDIMKSKAVIKYEGHYIPLQEYCDGVKISSDIVFDGLLKLTDNYLYNILAKGL